MNITSFDKVIEEALQRAEAALQKSYYQRAEKWYDLADNLYHQHPTGNLFLEKRKFELYRSLFER